MTGRRPFKGDVFSLRDKHLDETPPALSSMAPEIGPFFDDILNKALAKKPEERYASITEFIEVLETANTEAICYTNYQEIQYLMKREAYARVLEQLEKNFIQPGHYEYKDVARLFGDMITAKKTEADYPTAQTTSPSLFQPPPPSASDPTQIAQSSDPHHQQLEKQHEISKYLIPFVIGAAVLAGAIIGPQISDLPRQPVVQILLLALLIAYLSYYIWAYYIAPSHNK